ncbi:hypothetical protein HDU79_008318 [Rhizoclosmatium sp. JEL0117]|nr:hypothetical protein HDU79_008318 [Rhizoclosmatium sp. JEL0117]
MLGSSPTFRISAAPSGTSICKKCKESMREGELRLVSCVDAASNPTFCAYYSNCIDCVSKDQIKMIHGVYGSVFKVPGLSKLPVEEQTQIMKKWMEAAGLDFKEELDRVGDGENGDEVDTEKAGDVNESDSAVNSKKRAVEEDNNTATNKRLKTGAENIDAEDDEWVDEECLVEKSDTNINNDINSKAENSENPEIEAGGENKKDARVEKVTESLLKEIDIMVEDVVMGDESDQVPSKKEKNKKKDKKDKKSKEDRHGTMDEKEKGEMKVKKEKKKDKKEKAASEVAGEEVAMSA